MQQTALNNAVNLASLTSVNPQYENLSKTSGYEASFSANRNVSYVPEKSFGALVKEAKVSAESEKKPVQSQEKTDTTKQVKSEETAVKTEKTAEKSEIAEKSSGQDQKEAGTVKKDLQQNEKVSEKTEKKQISYEITENLLKNAVKNGQTSVKSDSAEKVSKEKDGKPVSRNVKSDKKNTKSDRTEKIKNQNLKAGEDFQKNFAASENNGENLLYAQLENAEKTAVKTEKTASEQINLDNKEISTDALTAQNNLSASEEFTLDDSSLKNEKTGKKFYLDKENKIAVHDLRTENQDNDSEKNEIKADSKDFITTVKIENNNAQIEMNLSNEAQQNLLSSNDQNAASQNSTFQSMLSNQIQSNASEIVKAGSIVLKDNNQGSIKLILHPESLGNVKIDLQISDKVITGKITVASQEAFNAFKESAENLKNAFNQSGFETGSFDLSFAGQNSSSNQNFAENQRDSRFYSMTQSYSAFTAVSDGYDEEEIPEFSGKTSVNIVA